MSNRTTNLLKHRKTEVELVTAELVGVGAGVPLINDAGQPGGSEIDAGSVARGGAGAYTFNIKRAFPQVIDAIVVCRGTTVGLQGKVTVKPDLHLAHSQVSIQLAVGAVGTDAAAADTIGIILIVRNSGRN